MTGPNVRLMNAPLRGPGEHCLAPIGTRKWNMGSSRERLGMLDMESTGDRVR